MGLPFGLKSYCVTGYLLTPQHSFGAEGTYTWGPASQLVPPVEEAPATIVFDHSCRNSAAMLFHSLALAFPLAVAPDRSIPRIAI